MRTFSVGVVGARGATPRGFRDGSQAEEMVAFVAIVAKKQLGWGFAGVAFLANNVVIVEDRGFFLGSSCSSLTQ
jgi:hypothetical protein